MAVGAVKQVTCVLGVRKVDSFIAEIYMAPDTARIFSGSAAGL